MSLPRHHVVVRVTHWIHTLAFLALLVSGVAILIAHPRLYWGETGTMGTPALVELPLPLTFGPSGWGRSLHFLAAWVAVVNGTWYVLFGLLSRHFRSRLLTSTADAGANEGSYNALQRLAYFAVVFALFPLVVVTGLAMSPALASVVPLLVEIFGGHQSARTMHFVVAGLLVLFVLVHVARVCSAGFVDRMRAMITG